MINEAVKKHIKAFKVAAFITATAISLGLIIISNIFLGNPVSKLLAYNAGKKYIEQNFADTDYKIKKVFYDFKSCGGYSVWIDSEEHIDEHFHLYTDMLGHIKRDYYYKVQDGSNTASRLDSDYNDAVNFIIKNTDLPIKFDSYGARLHFRSHDEDPELEDVTYNNIFINAQTAEYKEDLDMNGIYDIQELGSKIGEISLFCYNDDMHDVEKIAEALLKIKDACNRGGVKFRYINYDSMFHIGYEDIYPEGLEERIEIAAEKMSEYYAELDREKKRIKRTKLKKC